MSEKTKKLFEQQENQLSTQSTVFMHYLVRKGLLSDTAIKNPEVRKVKQEQRKAMFHNTELLLKHYRNIKWVLECFPDNVAEDLEAPYKNLDALLSTVDTQLALDNARLLHRLESLKRSRLLIDRLDEALTMLQNKPGNGPILYKVIYMTYIQPNEPKHNELLAQLNLSGRQYYRLRQQAFTLLSIRLWSTPVSEMDAWIEIMTLVEML